MIKRCPIMSKQNESLSKIYCFKDECAFWDEEKGQCCIKTMALAAARSADYNAPYKVSLTPATVNPITGEVSI